jgi:tetratricopeptide (TPR) repeat protein
MASTSVFENTSIQHSLARLQIAFGQSANKFANDPHHLHISQDSSSPLTPLGTIRSLVREMMNFNEVPIHAIRERYSDISILLNLSENFHKVDITKMTNGPIWFNLRRLSRETTLTCHSFVKLSLFLSECVRSLGVTRIVITDFHNTDTASLSVLLRFLVECRLTHLELVLCFSDKEHLIENRLPQAIWDDYAFARKRIFEAFLNYCPTEEVGEVQKVKATMCFSRIPSSVKESSYLLTFDHFFERLSSYTTLLMYDCAYLYAQLALERAVVEPQRWFIQEVLVLLDLNIKDAEAGLSRINAILAGNLSNVQLARFLYIKGVVLAKRQIAIDSALSAFYQGMSILQCSINAASELELGWLANGIGLCYAALSKTFYNEKRRKCLELALAWEQHARTLVDSQDTRDSRFLNANIMTNISTVYEILGNYKQALTIWHQFSTFIGSTQALPSYNIHYRQGILNFHNGNYTGAVKDFNKSLDQLECDRPLDFAACSRVHYGLAYLYNFLSTEEKRVEHHLNHATNLAERILDKEGLLQCHHFFRMWQDKSLQNKVKETTVLLPRPKLPAFYPFIDLANQPDIDFNRMLREPQ